ncbi:MAG: HAMP domain-containing histidine kinase, partial [Proteobacteria bacterium]|nr:HAMP domain-containing histidine kinase [Pseudomonadota bacterium]
FKIGLILSGFVIVATILWYTHTIVQLLQDREKQIADLYAKSLAYLAAARSVEGDYSFVFDEVIRKSYFIDFPIVLTDADNEPILPTENAFKNIEIPSSLADAERRAELRRIVADLDRQNPPIRVTYQDTVVLNLVHYGESPLVTQLRWLPYIEISIVVAFILIGYAMFSYVKRTEQGNIWVGMARETAHQLGTPISSMMGWIELLKHQAGGGGGRLSETLHDMENDLQRLQKIADRFSKIGSRPDLKDENLIEVIRKVLEYFTRRLPHMGKKVEIVLSNTEPVHAKVNRELFEWVLENLTKNALDAIETGVGRITIAISEHAGSVIIDITDTGKGIDPSYRKEVFRPGFSTKTRGWGLGLSLSQRIIETYHRGRLMLKESRPNAGTTFRIKLRK